MTTMQSFNLVRRLHRLSFAATFAWLVGSALPALAADPSAARAMLITWRGCEEACIGFRDRIAAIRPQTNLVIRDAARSPERARGFLAEARSTGVGLLVTWGTSATLAVAGTLSELDDPSFNHDIPQVFMIVSDPVGVGLVRDLDRPGRRNLTGTYNRVPEEVNIQTIRSYMPGFRKLGLVYNANEPNSIIKRDEMAELASSMAYEFVSVEVPIRENGRPDASDIPAAVRSLKAQDVDFLYLGSSSFLRANGRILADAARQYGLPLLSPYEELVRGNAALISVAARYRDIGRLAADRADRLLRGDHPADGLPIAQVTDFAVVVNLDTARALGLYPPIGLLQIVETVN